MDSIGDYVTFSHFPYKDRKEANPPSSGEVIQLYMPNSTAQVTNSQGWGELSLPGPAGQVMLGAMNAAGQAIGGVTGTIDEAGVSSTVEALKSTIETGKSNIRGIGAQILSGAAANVLGVSGNQFTSIAMGKIFNPNTELTYDGPGMRTFSMSFNFVPKRAEESTRMNEIIRAFKKFSAPDEADQGMFEVPHVWQVTYYSAERGGVMNLFKPAALTAVTIQANPSAPFHQTFKDGTPIEMGLGLNFKEVELLTRKDHEEGLQGY